MINKIILIFGLISCLSLSKTFSQSIIFGYDENGNRTIRKTLELTQNSRINSYQENQENSSDTSIVQKNILSGIIGGNKILIYPNPVEYNVTVEVENITDKDAEITVYDSYGKNIEKIKIIENQTNIDFSNKAMGTYLIKLNINSKSDVWKIIKK